MKKLQIGNVTLDNPIILAPMAGVSDLPFRLLCREMGAALVCMEMVSAKAIYYKNKNTQDLMRIADSCGDGKTHRGASFFHSGPEHGMPGTKGSE